MSEKSKSRAVRVKSFKDIPSKIDNLLKESEEIKERGRANGTLNENSDVPDASKPFREAAEKL